MHGDDFLILGDSQQLKWLGDNMRESYDIKMDILGPGDDGTVTVIKILNRILRWEHDGIAYEPDQRHVDQGVGS